MKYDTIIFDLDGTLLNTLDDLKDSLNFALEKYGYQERTLEEVRSFVGNGVRKLVQRSLPLHSSEKEVEQCLATFTAHYNENMQNKTRPYDGIMELLLHLDRCNYKLAIVSNKFDTAVKELAKEYFSDFINIAIGDSSKVKRKPAPDAVYKAIDNLGSDIKKTIYVGDSETDVQTAKNAGIPCVGVTWGFRTREVLRNEGAEYLIDTPKELLTII
ncbi:MAG: HAD-IIIA family hydrolase [Anaerolineaceae bacterium]|nr:MAG: HAD-IIIA family hydrolase [Anaerolineaceae bacterium]